MRVIDRGLAMGVVVLGLSSGLLFGCKDQEKCNEALTTARKAMQDEFLDMALARQWRDHAGKICGAGPEVEALDKEILAKEAAITKAAEDKAKAEADAGAKALEDSKKLWAKFDKLEDKEKTEDELKKVAKKADKLALGVTPDYGKQVLEYNKKQRAQRKKALEKLEKK